jgi:hypothetical protein
MVNLGRLFTQGFPAVGHSNVAVGHGLVDTAAALAKL